MLFSFNELKKLANLKPETTKDQVIDAINTIGFEVESVSKFTDVSGLKFGKILEINPNPNGNKLNVCQIQFDDKKRIIQTTDKNVEVGQTIIAFVPGSKLKNITFEAKELRGIVSEGMLSNISEYGIDQDLLRPWMKDGITSYPVSDLSIDPIKWLDLEDYIIEVDILSNRSDANSYYIMAMELAAFFGTKPLKIKDKEANLNSKIKVKKNLAHELVLIEAKNNFDVSIQEQIFLIKNNVKTIDNIIDLTNLTLLYTGQPTHAYDKASVGENFSTSLSSKVVKILGNKEVKLKDDLVVTSDNKITCVAGVIGLEATKSTSETKNIIFEMGVFPIKDVRKAVKSVKINTNASNQSSKKISQGTTKMAIKYLSSKLKNFSLPIDSKSKELETNVKYNSKITSMLAGFEISKDPKYKKALESLKTLGFYIGKEKIKAPSYRHDVKSQQDIDEEIFRFYGYDNLKEQKPKLNPSKVSNIKNLSWKMAAQGYAQAITYSLVSQTDSLFNPFAFKDTISLKTYVSEERKCIRNSIAISLEKIIDYHQKRKMNHVSFFDSGMINDGIKVFTLASTTKSFEQMKQDVCNLVSHQIRFKPSQRPQLHPGFSADIYYQGNPIGWIGKIHPKLIKTNAIYAEFKIPEINNEIKFKPYKNDPLKTRDITFVLKSHENLDSYIKMLNKLDLFSIRQIDEYVDPKTNEKKVTLQIAAEESEIKKIDQKFNK